MKSHDRIIIVIFMAALPSIHVYVCTTVCMYIATSSNIRFSLTPGQTHKQCAAGRRKAQWFAVLSRSAWERLRSSNREREDPSCQGKEVRINGVMSRPWGCRLAALGQGGLVSLKGGLASLKGVRLASLGGAVSLRSRGLNSLTGPRFVRLGCGLASFTCNQ